MTKPPRLYTRLTRPLGGVGSYRSLWLAADHLLLVSSTGFNEDYRRVLLRDIQGVFVLKSDRRMWWAITLGLFTAISGIPFILGLVRDEQPIGSGIFFTLFGIPSLINWFLGPTCRVFFVTGVQTLREPSLVRLRKARRVLARLTPAITEAQADRSAPVSTPPPQPPPLV